MRAFDRVILIRFQHCDPAGIVFYPRFFEFTNQVVEDWFEEELGLPSHQRGEERLDFFLVSALGFICYFTFSFSFLYFLFLSSLHFGSIICCWLRRCSMKKPSQSQR